MNFIPSSGNDTKTSVIVAVILLAVSLTVGILVSSL